MDEINQKKPSGRGGRRPGAGRKVGATTKKTREIAEQAVAEGITPLEVMMRAMRKFVENAEKMAGVDEAGSMSLMKEAADVAKNAAPYIHPRLAAMEITGKNGKDLVPEAPKGVLVVPGVLDEKAWEKMMAKQETAYAREE